MYNILLIISMGTNMIGFNTQIKYNITTSKNLTFIKNIYITPEINVGIRGEVEIIGTIRAGL